MRTRIFIVCPNRDGDKTHKVCLKTKGHRRESALDAYQMDHYEELGTYFSISGALNCSARNGVWNPNRI